MIKESLSVFFYLNLTKANSDGSCRSKSIDHWVRNEVHQYTFKRNYQHLRFKKCNLFINDLDSLVTSSWHWTLTLAFHLMSKCEVSYFDLTLGELFHFLFSTPISLQKLISFGLYINLWPWTLIFLTSNLSRTRATILVLFFLCK